jgi:hypothetical protein
VSRPDDPHNVRERLWKATRALAVSAQPIRQRLLVAATEIAPLLDRDFEDDEGKALRGAIDELLTTQGTLEETVDGLSDDQAERLAELIFELDSHYRPSYG